MCEVHLPQLAAKLKKSREIKRREKERERGREGRDLRVRDYTSIFVWEGKNEGGGFLSPS